MKLATASALATSVLAAALPLTAHATAPARYEVFVPSAAAARQPLAHFASSLARPADRERALRRRQLATVAGAGVPASLLRAAQVSAAPQGAQLTELQDDGVLIAMSSSGGLSTSALLPAGDVNGDGVRDLLDVRYGKTANNQQAVLTAVRSGTTGAVVWHRLDAVHPQHFVFPVPTSVGGAGHPGVVLFDVGFEKRSNDTIDVSDRLTALDGRAGRKLWTHGDRGSESFANGFSGKHEPNLTGFLQTGPGPKSALVTISDYSDDGSGTQNGTVAVYRISGANGAATLDGAPVTSSDAIPRVFGFTDLSGDTREDYLVLTSGASPSVEARQGGTGQSVWRNTSVALQPGAYPLPAGRLTGATVQDLAVTTGTPAPTLPTLGTPAGDVADPTSPAHGQVALLRGDTGAQVWSQTGDGAFAVQRAGAGKAAAVGVTTSDTTSDANGTTETLHLQAYDLSGTQLYDQAYTVQAPADRSSGTFSYGFADAFAVGDLQQDGALDGEAVIFAVDGSNTRIRTLLFDGSNGTALPGDHELVGGSLTGAGDDLVDVTAGTSITVTARSGRDLHPLFVRRLPTHARTDHAYAYGEKIRGRCAGLIVLGGSKASGYAAVLTAAGVPRWSIEHAANDLTAKAATLGVGPRSASCG